MTRRNRIVLAILVIVIAGIGTFFVMRKQRATDEDADLSNLKTGYIEGCMKQANDTALQLGKPFNEEQKRMLQQICSCAADRLGKEFSHDELLAFQANPADPAKLDRVKAITQDCAAATSMPATNQ
ncbi:MAG TPA: hypothetical protein VM659_05920 [Dongiaceae bacterium]|nr:hypothetical protein [Dongiaceae bacterium]